MILIAHHIYVAYFTHQFRSTKTQRTIESAREFFEGVFPNYEFDLPAPILNDTVLRVKYGRYL